MNEIVSAIFEIPLPYLISGAFLAGAGLSTLLLRHEKRKTAKAPRSGGAVLYFTKDPEHDRKTYEVIITGGSGGGSGTAGGPGSSNVVGAGGGNFSADRQEKQP